MDFYVDFKQVGKMFEEFAKNIFKYHKFVCPSRHIETCTSYKGTQLLDEFRNHFNHQTYDKMCPTCSKYCQEISELISTMKFQSTEEIVVFNFEDCTTYHEGDSDSE